MYNNDWKIEGNLVKTPEVKFTQTGKAFTRFTVAINRKKKDGTEAETVFVDCTAWDGIAERIAEEFERGMRINVWGSYAVSHWVAKDGTNRHSPYLLVEKICRPVYPKKKQESGFEQFGKATADEQIPF